MVLLAFLPFQEAGCNLSLVKQVNDVDVRKVESALTHSVVTAFLSSWKSISPVKFTHWNFWFYSSSCHQLSTVCPGSRFSPFCNSSSSSTQFAFGNRKLSEPLSDSSFQSLWVFPFLPFRVWMEVGGVSGPVSLRVAGNGHFVLNMARFAESTFHQAQWVWGSDELTLWSNVVCCEQQHGCVRKALWQCTRYAICQSVSIMSCVSSAVRRVLTVLGLWGWGSSSLSPSLDDRPPERRTSWMTAQRPMPTFSDSADLPETEIPVSFY